MREAFEKGGYPDEWLLALDLKPNDGSSITAAERAVAPAVTKLLEVAQSDARKRGCVAPEKVDIVVHSMGSMAARWYIAKVDATRVKNLVGIAPANHGSNALCGLPGSGNQELCPAYAQDERDSRLQVQLNGTTMAPLDETPFGSGADRADVRPIAPDDARKVQYTTFRLAQDEWLDPASSPVLDGAGGLRLLGLDGSGVETSSGNVLWHRSVPHDDLPREAALIATVLGSLQQDAAP